MLSFARQIYRDQRAVAYIEFAFAFPVLLVTFCGGIELMNLAAVHVRLNHIAETAADNAARVRTQLDEADIANIFAGVELVGQSIDFTDKGRVVLSSIQDNGLSGTKEGQWIRWQRCDGNYDVEPKYGTEGIGKSDGTLSDGIGTKQQIGAAPGTALLFAEVTYQYDPLIFKGFIAPRVLRYEAAFNVRERTNFGITNVTGMTVKSC